MSARSWCERVLAGFAEEWHGDAPGPDLEAELARARGREVARVDVDRELLGELRVMRARQEKTLAVDGLDLLVLDTVIDALAARLPQDERSTA